MQAYLGEIRFRLERERERLPLGLEPETTVRKLQTGREIDKVARNGGTNLVGSHYGPMRLTKFMKPFHAILSNLCRV